MSRARITHVIGSLALGGAERSLCALTAHHDSHTTAVHVVTLLDGGPLRRTLEEQGVVVESLAMKRRLPDPLAILRLARVLRRQRPDVVVTWLDHSNVIGGLAAQLAGRVPVVWNIRHCAPMRNDARALTRLVGWSSTRLSPWLPERIVYVSQAARTLHAETGFADDRAIVIPNGFDPVAFHPDPQARRAVRDELGVARDCLLVGLFGRYHADKDHANFLRAAARIRQSLPAARFLLCGTDIDAGNSALVHQLDRSGLRDACHLLGPRDDMARLAASLDLQVSSSVTEAMPRVVGEAMACGVPCVVTDVGDSALLVGDTGHVVPAGDDRALADHCLALLQTSSASRQALGLRARQRIVEQFSLDRMVVRHFDLWTAVAGKSITCRPETMPLSAGQAA
jgi:glycosyltransferase involved in cell wall biosynthesis